MQDYTGTNCIVLKHASDQMLGIYHDIKQMVFFSAICFITKHCFCFKLLENVLQGFYLCPKKIKVKISFLVLIGTHTSI